MRPMLHFVLAGFALTASHAATRDDDSSVVILESFENPRFTWEEVNDPVMGGKSKGTFVVKDGVGHFQGQVVDVPFLHAPGFIQANTVPSEATVDVSHCTGIELVLKSNTDYQGYRFSFGTAHAPGGKYFAKGYKTTLKDVPVGNDNFDTISIPFEEFTDFWDDATGDPIHTCQENILYCPDELTLKTMKHLAIWGEGVAGTVDLEIKTIRAFGCDAV